ncbi:hypothetical protein JTB14_014092 [Gonioctena quinquepunctata]|nr:hypothetical protein JTB14_014092 [Gonioctena quinquepunctata]
MEEETLEYFKVSMKFIHPVANAVECIEILLKTIPISNRIVYAKEIKNMRPEVYKSYVEKHSPGCSGENKEERFITPNKRTRLEPKKVHSLPKIAVSNRYAVLGNTAKESVEITNRSKFKKLRLLKIRKMGRQITTLK